MDVEKMKWEIGAFEAPTLKPILFPAPATAPYHHLNPPPKNYALIAAKRPKRKEKKKPKAM